MTPEYNRFDPGRAQERDRLGLATQQPFNGKPIAIMGASPGKLGAGIAAPGAPARLLRVPERPVMTQPEVLIGDAPMFDDQGRLTDQATREFIGKLLVSLADWTHRLARA